MSQTTTTKKKPNIVPKARKKIVHAVKTFEGESSFVVPSRGTLVDTNSDTIIAQSGAGGAVDVVGVNEEFANLISVPPTCSPAGPAPPLPPSGPSTPTCSGPWTGGGGGTTSGGTTSGPTCSGGTTTTPPPTPPVCGPWTGGGGTTQTGTSTPPPSNNPPIATNNNGNNNTQPATTFIFVPPAWNGNATSNDQMGTIATEPDITNAPAPAATPASTPMMGGGFGGGGGGSMAPEAMGDGTGQSFFQKNKMLIGGLLILGIVGYLVMHKQKTA